MIKCKARGPAIIATIGAYLAWAILCVWAAWLFDRWEYVVDLLLLVFLGLTFAAWPFPGRDVPSHLPEKRRVELANAEQIKTAWHVTHPTFIGATILFWPSVLKLTVPLVAAL